MSSKRDSSSEEEEDSSPTYAKTSDKKNVDDMNDLCKYIPLRLTEDERRYLKVIENALEVSDYTDVVDVYGRKSKQNRMVDALVDVLSISSGLLIANNLAFGEKLVQDGNLSKNMWLFRDMFEIARRYKIMNPSKMRNTYGKLMFLLQDSQTSAMQQATNYNLVKDILTVHSFLKERGGLEMLSDQLLTHATKSINNVNGSVTREELVQLGQLKENAAAKLVLKYKTDTLDESEIERVINSISDYNAYLTFNVIPVEILLKLLKENFDPSIPDDNFSLSLVGTIKSKMKTGFSSLYSYTGYSSRFSGSGACLSHDHPTQYAFVLQSLTLWREVMLNMTRLWMAADRDLLMQPYHLQDTGQGLNRVQSCPTVRSHMTAILSRVQRGIGRWVGLSVVHLGDRDVPNALVFIDKYAQVPRILSPIAACIEKLPNLVHDQPFHAYVKEEWGSIESLRMQILSDFFKHGFDGSGDDGGSCIDGRLTSTWNWCSKLMKKPYYYVFMFTGFQGFDGDWKD